MHQFCSIFIFLLLSAVPALAQRKCFTYPDAKDPSAAYRPGGKYFEDRISALARESDKSVQNDGDSLYYLPVVVHVLHIGEPEGSGRNISIERIQSQIDILNQDYGRQPGSPGFNTHPDGADTRIRFCLASRDPDGNPSNGVVRVNTGVDAFSLSQNAQIKAYSIWNPEKYLNIWVCQLLNNYLGYAQYPIISPLWSDSLPMVPGAEDVQPDGVVIDPRVFGDVPPGESGSYGAYNKGRTASHEIGHYLGLLHIWGDGFSCADNKTDYCSDTPPQGTYTSGCPASALSCITNVPAMKENYMDYTNDACMNIFTAEQKKRMRLVLRNCIRRKSVLQNVPACGLTSITPEVPANKPGTVRLMYSDQGNEIELVPSDMEISGFQMFDLPGRLMRSETPEKDFATYPLRISLQSLAPGTYFIRVKDGSGQLRQLSFRRF